MPNKLIGFLLAPVTRMLASESSGFGVMRLKRFSEITDIPAPVSNNHLSDVLRACTVIVGRPCTKHTVNLSRLLMSMWSPNCPLSWGETGISLNEELKRRRRR